MLKAISKDLDDLMTLVTQEDCSELKKLIIENPQAPLLIFAGEEANSGVYGYESVAFGSASLKEITLYGEYWLDKEDYEENLRDDMSYDNKYENLSNEKFDEEVRKIMKETVFVKAIVVYVG